MRTYICIYSYIQHVYVHVYIYTPLSAWRSFHPLDKLIYSKEAAAGTVYIRVHVHVYILHICLYRVHLLVHIHTFTETKKQSPNTGARTGRVNGGGWGISTSIERRAAGRGREERG